MRKDKLKHKLDIIKAAMEIGVTKAAELYQVGRKSVGVWVKEYQQNGESALAYKRKANPIQINSMPEAIAKQIIELKTQNPAWSAAKIKEFLNLDYSLTIINKKIRTVFQSKSLSKKQEFLKSYEFKLYTRKIDISEYDQVYYAIIFESMPEKICFVGLCRERNTANIAIFSDYFFNLLKSGAGCSLSEVNIYSTDPLLTSKHNLVKKVAAKYLVHLHIKNSETDVNLKKMISETIETLPVKDNIQSDLHTALLIHYQNYRNLLTEEERARLEQQFPPQILIECIPIITDQYCSDVESVLQSDCYRISDDIALNKLREQSLLQLEVLANSEFQNHNNSQAIIILKNVLCYLEILPNNSMKLNVLHKLGQIYQKIGDWQQSEEYYQAALILAKNCDDSVGILKSNNLLGILAVRQNDYKKASVYYHAQIVLARKYDLIEQEINAHQSLGVLNNNRCNYRLALEHYNQVLILVERTGNLVEKAKAFGNIGIVYYKKSNFKKARHYFEEAIFLAERENDERQLSRLYSNLGGVLEEQGMIIQALECQMKTYDISRKHDNQSWLAAAINNIGNLYLALGEYSKALSYFNDFLAIVLKTSEKENQSIAYGNIGSVYKALNSFASAEKNFQKAISISAEIESLYYLCSFYHDLADLYFKQKKYESAAEYILLALDAAIKAEREDTIFSATILNCKINYYSQAVSPNNFQMIFTQLSEMLKNEKDKDNKAILNYELLLLLKNYNTLNHDMREQLKIFRRDALSLSKSLYKRTGAFEYKARINELQTK